MATVTEDGFAKPFDPDGQFYPTFGGRIPALRGFYLAYDINDSTPADHEINLIQVLVGGQSEDLSPNADLSPANIPDGRLDVTLQDASPTGEEFFYKVSHSLLGFPGARRFQIRDVGCVGQCVQKLPIPSAGPAPNLFPPIIALVGFKLFFTGARDHELDRVGVWFRGNDLHVAMRDKNGDDTFGYLVDFVVINPTPDLNVSSGIQRGNARGGKTISIPNPLNTDFLLTGWAFNFVSGDHEIRDLGVLRDGDNVTLFYGDKNADDLFDWRVEWAHVGRRVFAPPA